MNARRSTPGADPILLAEAGLVLLLLGLFIALYLVPAEDGAVNTPWWASPLLAGLFFGVLALERWRRKRREHGASPRSRGQSGADRPETRV